jgi:hypothetical protein
MIRYHIALVLASVNGAKTFSLLHFCKHESEKVKKLTLFVLWNASTFATFIPFGELELVQKSFVQVSRCRKPPSESSVLFLLL